MSIHDTHDLTGRTAWITGASRGLGRDIALAMGDAGATVILSARDADRLSDVTAEIVRRGGRAFGVPGSVTDRGWADSVVQGIVTAHGRLDILVCGAGVSPSFSPADKVDDDTWELILDTNLSGTFRCCRAAGRVMITGGGGAIVNISSIHGQVAFPKLAAYSASKGAVEMLTRGLALDWARHNIRVNALAPGYCETDMTADLRDHEKWQERLLNRIPTGRFGLGSDIAQAAVFLASPAAGYITGTTLTVDGGWTAQ